MSDREMNVSENYEENLEESEDNMLRDRETKTL
jgi:hypothetical protein